MTTAYLIPATGQEVFGINLNGRRWRLTFRYLDDPGPGWVMDIANADDVQLVQGIPLIPGQDLVAPYPGLFFGGELRAINDADDAPGPLALGRTLNVYYVVR